MIKHLASILLVAVSVCQAGEEIPFDSDRWVIKSQEHRFEEHLGRKSLYLRNGIAWVNDAGFTDGVVEFDVSFTGERGFMGGAWRIVSEGNYEEFYVRPHQSGKPDACQYTPAFDGLTSWQLYHGPGYGAVLELPTTTWNRVRIVVSGSQAEVFFNDMERPALFIRDQKRPTEPGDVGVNAYFASAHFSSFQFEAKPIQSLQGTAPAAPVAPEGVVTRWLVSDTFDGRTLDGVHRLTQSRKDEHDWEPLTVEASGLANLARVRQRTRERDTVFARTTLKADKDRIGKLRFGYSDRVKLYLNGTLVYAGDNSYRSRDYRYLGTIGYFDEVYLPLREGDNELWLAVSEAFGGWGVQAVLE